MCPSPNTCISFAILTYIGGDLVWKGYGQTGACFSGGKEEELGLHRRPEYSKILSLTAIAGSVSLVWKGKISFTL